MLAAAAAVLAAAFPSFAPDTAEPAWLVQLRPAAVCSEAASLAAAGAVSVAPELRLYRLPSSAARLLAPGLRTRDAASRIGPDRPVGTLSAQVRFADPLSDQEWWRAAVGADTVTPPGPGKPVTVVDTGIDVTHPEFAGRPNTTTLNPQEPPEVGGEHGTSVSSLIGAPENGVGMVGIYPQADLRSWDAARGQGTELTTTEIVNGILEAAKAGPGVINLSLGGDRDPLIEQAVYQAAGRGALVVAASGNDGDRGNTLGYPAGLPHVLTVAATNRSHNVTSFSSTSRYVDVAAPGEDVVVASALQKGFHAGAGTSFAAPLVSGAAAWVWTMRPELDWTQLAEVMRRSAVDIGPPGRDNSSGYGLLNVARALTWPAPIRDPLEPNDDVDVVVPGETFSSGVAPLTTRVRTDISLTARIDRVEDPRDVYRVFLPARKTATVSVISSVDADVRVLPATAISWNEGGQLAAGSLRRGGTDRAVVKAAPRARAAFVVVTPGRNAGASFAYRLTIRNR